MVQTVSRQPVGHPAVTVERIIRRYECVKNSPYCIEWERTTDADAIVQQSDCPVCGAVGKIVGRRPA